MISAEEQQILVSLSEISQDIKSHLMLIGELAARKRKADTRRPSAAVADRLRAVAQRGIRDAGAGSAPYVCSM